MNNIFSQNVGDFIIVNKRHLGRIHNTIWDGNGHIIKLENDDNYIDNMIQQYKILGNFPINGYMLVTNKHNIDIPDMNSIMEVINIMMSNTSLLARLNKKLLDKYKILIELLNTNEEDISKKVNLFNITKYKNEDIGEDYYSEYILKMLSEIFVENNNILYEEIITAFENTTSLSIDILDEEHIMEYKDSIKKILESYNKINLELYYDFKKTLSYLHIMLDTNDKIIFGRQLIKEIRTSLENSQSGIKIRDGKEALLHINLFDFIKFRIVDNYIEISNRFNIDNFRVITEELIPNLKYSGQIYGMPIDYELLSSLILKNKNSSDIIENQYIINEAINIMSLEYQICLQPKIDFLLWAIHRLLYCWYADSYLYENIYKIKILINLYRARGLKQLNKDIDVQPIIIIIPKYGKEIARKVSSILSYYFFTYKRLGWKESKPTYFNSLDDLLHYTNGSIDFKKYIKFITGNKKQIFDNNFTKVNIGSTQNDIEYEINKN